MTYNHGNHGQSPFEKAIGEFTQGLSRRDVEDFRITTLEHLETTIANLQAIQHSQRRLQDLSRLGRFLKAIEQYGKVVAALYGNNVNIVAFVWGPLKFILQQTNMVDAAFRDVVSAYGQLGEALPLLEQYQDLFRAKRQMVQSLELMYEDILKFQHIILRYFGQPQWKALFKESWRTCQSRLHGRVSIIAQQRSFIESQANSSPIEEVRNNIQLSRQIQDGQFDQQDLQRHRDVMNWLRPTNVQADQATFAKIRADYPGTGQWLLENQNFKDWFHPLFHAIPPLLWLNGIPGAGKTMLASMVVQKARELKPAPTVLYFYCKHDDPERNNFVSLGRSLLAQFLDHDNDLLPTFYQRSCRSVESEISSLPLVEELLTLAFANCQKAYVILDGLDECPREERRTITQWFRKLVENLPSDESGRLRCLFVSQDDGHARKDFKGLIDVKIKPEHSQLDIEEYCRAEADKLLESHASLPAEKVNWIAATVAESVGGLFLLARLIWGNLSAHTSLSRLEEEIQPDVFPKTINEAYRRIMVRILENSPEAVKEDTLRLLGWLTCAKRPLKWHEIQVMNSINREGRCIALEHQSFIKTPKDLLASLVEEREDGSLEFFHLTVKFFLLDEGHVVPSKEELNLATLCVDYLNLPSFVHPPTPESVKNGDYGFMDYAVLFWLRHLEVGVTIKTDGEENLKGELAESLEIFINQYWRSPSGRLTLAKRHSDKLEYFKTHFKTRPIYSQLEKAVASTRQQLKCFGNMREEDIALSLTSKVYDVRKTLESILSDASEATRHHIEGTYGTNLFKCPRFSCQFFTAGFPSAVERDNHVSKHERPFRCPDETCFGYVFGFSSVAEREKHMRENHLDIAIQDEDFPTQQEVERSIARRQAAVEVIQNPYPWHSNTGDVARVRAEQSGSEDESNRHSGNRPPSKRPRQTEFKCLHCQTVYKKRYNLQSHLLSHNAVREHACSVCGKDFVRLSDLTRHMKMHTGDKKFVCSGVLSNGASWGCGRSFPRADTLRKHHESRIGRSCIQLLQQERESGSVSAQI